MKILRFILLLSAILMVTTSCEMSGLTSIKDKITGFFTGDKSSEENDLAQTPTADERASDALVQGDIAGAIDAYVEPPTTGADCVVTQADRESEGRLPASEETCEDRFSEKSVLYIGDSHSYLHSEEGSRMGNQVANKVKSCGASSFHYEGFCGSRPKHWFGGKKPSTSCGHSSMGEEGFHTSSKGKGDDLATLSEKTGAEHVMINLGDNMFNWRKENGKLTSYIGSPEAIITEVRGLVSELSNDQECTWIGPTYHSAGKSYHKLNETVDVMYDLLDMGIAGRCRLIDSRPVFESTSPNDGLHLVESESKVWGEKIAEKL